MMLKLNPNSQTTSKFYHCIMWRTQQKNVVLALMASFICKQQRRNDNEKERNLLSWAEERDARDWPISQQTAPISVSCIALQTLKWNRYLYTTASPHFYVW